MENDFLILIMMVISFLFTGISCDNSPDDDDINPDYLIGAWNVKKGINKTHYEGVLNGIQFLKDTSDKQNLTDTLSIADFKQDSCFIYEYVKGDSLYTEMPLTYQLSGNTLTVNTFFVDSGNGNYEKRTTVIKSLSQNYLNIEHIRERKITTGTNWQLLIITSYRDFEKYSGLVPPESWPDSVVIVYPDNNFHSNITPAK